ncbi:hypothetical protein [Arcobacter aquimarinus]|uniref:Membrane protein n=1 Tax=Arcobacter aquimarinus TaxID=1315211 RepID=A0AAE7B0L5_9BACT|nr:hypothetical protein [Arcobacter aquimarinus]QKE24796.1 putative membrane protein [Arcobacter aquimarinus]RXI35081.1 hypothetical protein CP986_08020 [Arcobacter aquimarinus]
MEKFDKILFFEKEYEKELQVKDNINNNITSILTLLTINITIFSYFIINAPLMTFIESTHKLAFVIFFIFIFCYIVYFIYTLMNLNQFYFTNKQYMKIPYADKLDEYFESLKEYDKDNFNYNVNNYLLSFYIEATSNNSKVNEYKNALQFEIRRFLFIKFFILFLTFIPYYIIMEGNLNTYNIAINNKEFTNVK